MSSQASCPRCQMAFPMKLAGGMCPHCLLAGLLEETAAEWLGEQPGDEVGPYELVEILGEGGMGSVWRARQWHPVEREVALKIVRLGMDTRDIVSRFEAERQNLAMMDHPGIARIYEAGATNEGRPYFAMELVEGESVTEYCVSRRLSLEDRLRLFLRICEAVEHAHRKGVLHRDLKPSNVLVTETAEGPRPKVIDFGIAKTLEDDHDGRTFFTKVGHAIGTPGYMSPEQAGAAPDVDTRSDVYSLGALLYELLTGVTPLGKEFFRKVAHDEVMRLIRETDPPRPSTRIGAANGTGRTTLLRIERDLDRVVMKALALDREQRYGGASSLAEDLRRFLKHEPVTATEPTLAYRSAKFVRKHRTGVSFSALIVLGMIVSAFLIARESQRSRAAAAGEKVARLEALGTLADSYRDAGLAASNSGDDALAALWFLQAYRTAEHDPERQRANRLRYNLFSARTPAPVRTFFLPRRREHSLLFDETSRFLHEAGPVHSFFHLERGTILDFGFEARAGCLVSGSDLAAVSDGSGRVEIRHLETLEITGEFELPEGKTSSLWSGPSGDLIAAGDHDIRIWNRRSKTFQGGVFKHSAALRFALFSPDGERLLTVDEKRFLRVFDTTSGRSEPLFEPLTTGGAGIHYRLFRFGEDSRRVRVQTSGMRWIDTETGGDLELLPNLSLAHDISPDGVLHTSHNKLVLSELDDQRFYRMIGSPRFLADGSAVFGTASGEIIDLDGIRRTRVNMGGMSQALSPDGSLLASRYNDGLAIHCLIPQQTYDRLSWSKIGTILTSDDGSLFTSAGFNGKPDKYFWAVRTFHTDDGTPAGPRIDLDYYHRCGAFLGPRGLLTGGSPGSSDPKTAREGSQATGIIEWWDVTTGKPLAPALELPSEPLVIRPHPEEPWLAVFCRDGSIQRLEADFSGLTEILRIDPSSGSQPILFQEAELLFSEDGARLHVAGPGKKVWTVDPQAGQVLHTTPNRRAAPVSMDVGKGLLVSSTLDPTDPWCFREKDGSALALDPSVKPTYNRRSRISPEGDEVLLSGAFSVEVLDWKSGFRSGPSFRNSQTGTSQSEFVRDSPWILTSSVGGFGLWDRRSGVEVSPLWDPLSNQLLDLAITSDGRRALISVVAKGLILIDLERMRAAEEWQDGLDDSDRLLFAELRAGHHFVGGRPVPYEDSREIFTGWRAFLSRNPELPPLKPSPAEMIRWHRNSSAYFAERSKSASKWHRERIEALREKK